MSFRNLNWPYSPCGVVKGTRSGPVFNQNKMRVVLVAAGRMRTSESWSGRRRARSALTDRLTGNAVIMKMVVHCLSHGRAML